MTNLDKLLKKIEKNYETSEKTTTKEYTVGGETYEVRTMTRKEKSEFLYSLKAQKDMEVGEIVKMMIKPIYKTFNLSQLATRAKESGYIKSYYDVVEMLFEPEEIIEITGFLFEMNKLSAETVNQEVEDIKKP